MRPPLFVTPIMRAFLGFPRIMWNVAHVLT
jgi:hypothetical protein